MLRTRNSFTVNRSPTSAPIRQVDPSRPVQYEGGSKGDGLPFFLGDGQNNVRYTSSVPPLSEVCISFVECRQEFVSRLKAINSVLSYPEFMCTMTCLH